MLTPEEQMNIISRATAEGYKGSFTELLVQEEQKRSAELTGQTIPPDQSEILAMQNSPVQVNVPPNEDPNARFTKAKPDATGGGLVQSYDGQVEGVGNFSTGSSLNNEVLYTPSEYKTGGFPGDFKEEDIKTKFSSSDFVKSGEYDLKNIKMEDFYPEETPNLFDLSGQFRGNIKDNQELERRLLEGNMRMTFGNDHTDYKGIFEGHGVLGKIHIKDPNIKHSFKGANIRADLSKRINDNIRVNLGLSGRFTEGNKPQWNPLFGANITFQDGGVRKYEHGGTHDQAYYDDQFDEEEFNYDMYNMYEMGFDDQTTDAPLDYFDWSDAVEKYGMDVAQTMFMRDGARSFPGGTASKYSHMGYDPRTGDVNTIENLMKKYNIGNNITDPKNPTLPADFDFNQKIDPDQYYSMIANVPEANVIGNPNADEHIYDDETLWSMGIDPNDYGSGWTPEISDEWLQRQQDLSISHDWMHPRTQMRFHQFGEAWHAKPDPNLKLSRYFMPFAGYDQVGDREGILPNVAPRGYGIDPATGKSGVFFYEDPVNRLNPIWDPEYDKYGTVSERYKLKPSQYRSEFMKGMDIIGDVTSHGVRDLVTVGSMFTGGGGGAAGGVTRTTAQTVPRAFRFGVNVDRTNKLLNPITKVVRGRDPVTGRFTSVKDLSIFNPSRYKFNPQSVVEGWKNLFRGRDVVKGTQLDPVKIWRWNIGGQRTASVTQGLSTTADFAHAAMFPEFAKQTVGGISDLITGEQEIYPAMEQSIGNLTEFVVPKGPIGWVDKALSTYKIGKDAYQGDDFSAIARTIGGSSGRSFKEGIQNLFKATRKTDKHTKYFHNTNKINSIFNMHDNDLLRTIYDPVVSKEDRSDAKRIQIKPWEDTEDVNIEEALDPHVLNPSTTSTVTPTIIPSTVIDSNINIPGLSNVSLQDLNPSLTLNNPNLNIEKRGGFRKKKKEKFKGNFRDIVFTSFAK